MPNEGTPKAPESHIEFCIDQWGATGFESTAVLARAELANLRSMKTALEEIADHWAQAYERTGGGQYGTGVTDGHRLCANIARAVLERKEPRNA